MNTSELALAGVIGQGVAFLFALGGLVALGAVGGWYYERRRGR